MESQVITRGMQEELQSEKRYGDQVRGWKMHFVDGKRGHELRCMCTFRSWKEGKKLLEGMQACQHLGFRLM
jgi:hypothetical protein